MIFTLIVFLIILIVSFILAYYSMRDFAFMPRRDDYGLFLIKRPKVLTAAVLDMIYVNLMKHEQIISMEKLFKGQQSALVIFGPRDILRNFQGMLNLLELEDYTNVEGGHILAWEVGIKDQHLFGHLPLLNQSEYFWWQITFQAQKKLPHTAFIGQIRAVVISFEEKRRDQLAQHFLTLGRVDNILTLYRQRGLDPLHPKSQHLTSQQIINLTSLN